MVADMLRESPEPLASAVPAPAASSPSVVLPQVATAPSAPSAEQPPALLSGTVITVPRLAALAREWLESARVICCACCGSPGLVVRVVEKNESPWTVARKAQLRQRRGLG